MLTSTTSELLPTSLVELRISFRRRLVKFRQLQVRYQPETAFLIARLSAIDGDVDTIQDTPLYLPSSLPPEILPKCSKRLVSMETELRAAQCRDSLTQLQTQLSAQARLSKYKFVHVRHQKPNTRSRNSIGRVGAKIEVLATKYRSAFMTLSTLDPLGKTGWRSEFLELRNQDIRALSEAELPNAPTQARARQLQARSLLGGGVVPEGNRTVSWIWRGSLRGLDPHEEFGEGSRILFSVQHSLTSSIEFRLEWSKTRAHQARWREEVSLLEEEMRRVLVYLKWKSDSWLRKGDTRAISLLTTCPKVLEGLHAYACRQACVFRDLHDHFLGIWKGLELPRECLTETASPAGLDQIPMDLDGDDV